MWGDPDADYEKVGALQAELEDKINACRRLEPRAQRRDRHGRAAVPAERRRRHHAVGRRAPPRGPVPAAALPPRPAAARRAHQPPRRRERRLAGALPAGVPGHRRGHHPRPLLPRQRRPAGSSSSTAGRGFPFEGNYSGWLEQKQARLAQEEKQASARQRTLQRELEWVRMAPKARQAKGRARLTAYDKLLAEAEADEGRGDRLEISIPPGRAPRRPGHRGRAPDQGLRRPAPHRGPLVLAAQGRHRRRHRPERRRQDDAVPHAHRPGAARRRLRHGRRHGASWPTSTRAATRSTPTRPSTRRSPAARTRSRSATARSTAGPTWPGSTSRAPTSRSGSATSRGGERNRVHLAKLLRDRRQRAAARRAHQRPRRRHAAGAGGRRSRPSPAAPSSSATTAGSSTGSAPTCSPSRATRRCAGSRATSPSTRRSATRSSAPTPTRPTASSTSRSPDDPARPAGRRRGDLRRRDRRDDRRLGRRQQQRRRHHVRPRHRGVGASC